MTLQWSSASTPAFSASLGADVSAAKDLGGDASVAMHFHVSFDVEGPSPSDADLLDYLGVIYNALDADGWTADLRFEQLTTVRRQIEDV